jgi:hypothetical protein
VVAAAPLRLDVWMYLVDQGQRVLRPVLRPPSDLPEARDHSGGFFATDGLVDLVERDAVQLPAPETLRRLCHAALAHYDGPPADDVTLMLLEWSQDAVRATTPTTTDPPATGGC